VSYRDDPFLGLEYMCGHAVEGNSVVLLRGKNCAVEGTCGREFVANEDGSLSPAEARHLVLGWAPVTLNCGGCPALCPQYSAAEQKMGLTLVAKGSPARVLMGDRLEQQTECAAAISSIDDATVSLMKAGFMVSPRPPRSKRVCTTVLQGVQKGCGGSDAAGATPCRPAARCPTAIQ
jgi:hypothetical protein